MVGENDQPISEKQGYPRNEEFNPRKGEDLYLNWFANLKALFDNMMANSQRVNIDGATASQVNNQTAALSIQTAQGLQAKLNDAYLGQADIANKLQNTMVAQMISNLSAGETQRLEHADEHDLHQRDNDRMTMEELYNLSPEEAAAIVPVLSGLLDILSKKQPKQ
ncbi:MAG: hypothetical protein IMF19_02665 [Proteobacteria bacterium]|nr:hypothetical protein [Pseudomonadota bacterium]